MSTLSAGSFGSGFHWGVSIAAAQNEGAFLDGGKSLSNWDTFARKQGKIKGGSTPCISADFYHRYKEDLLLTKALGFNAFRFSLSWSRIIPDGTGTVNKEGILFYHKIIDECLELGLTPFVTIYHWDMPQNLEDLGGWTSPLMVRWFSRYVKVCGDNFGDRVKNWIVVNEPLTFTALGYMLGKHAPGKTGLKNFFDAILNAALAQAEGGRIIRKEVKDAYIGTTFSCSEIFPYTNSNEDKQAANRIDILMNRLFLEPAIGRGFPRDDDFPFLRELELCTSAWKYTTQMQFDFDFIGLQNYFPVTVRHDRFVPVIRASEVKPVDRNVPHTDFGWEINADSFYNIVKRISRYPEIKEIVITENGSFFKDTMVDGRIADIGRTAYFQNHLQALQRVQSEGINIRGYFAWTLTDNFEWNEGYHARFGLIHVDFKSQLRTIKDSGHWWRSFLKPA